MTLDEIRKIVDELDTLASQAGGIAGFNMNLASSVVKAATMLAEQKHEIQSMRWCIIALLVKGFPNGVSLTRKEGLQAGEYRLWSATDSDDVLTLRAKPALPEEARAEGGLDDENDDDDMLESLVRAARVFCAQRKPGNGDDA